MKQRAVRILFFLFAISLWPLAGHTGQVYGTVFGAGGPLGNAAVSIQCPGIGEARRNTDGYGSYSVYVNGSGRCRISVNGASMEIRVYDDEVRYDLQLDGNTLRRR